MTTLEILNSDLKAQTGKESDILFLESVLQDLHEKDNYLLEYAVITHGGLGPAIEFPKFGILCEAYDNTVDICQINQIKGIYHVVTTKFEQQDYNDFYMALVDELRKRYKD